MKDYECNYTTTSPHYQQANEQVERSVQTVKDLMTKSKDINKALLSYGNTPFDTIKLSLAQMMMGRRLKTTLLTTTKLLKAQAQENVKDKLTQVKLTQKKEL